VTQPRTSPSARGSARAGPAGLPYRSPLTAVSGGWRKHRDLLDGASSLAATTGVTSLLGFAYWAVAARLFPLRAVGYGSAAVSAMSLIALVGMLGLGTVLIGELPRRKPRAGLVSAALLASGLGSLVLGLAFAMLAPHISVHFHNMSRTPGQAALFIAGVVLTAIGLVFDQATIGLMRGGLQLTRNLIFAIAKLAALPAAAVIVMHDQFGIGITLSWVVGTAVSLLLVGLQLHLTGTRVLPGPDWRVLRSLGGTAVAHSWLNLAISVPRSLMPVLVTVVVSPAANAAFYAAWTLSGFLYIVPVHLATVLFAVAAADPQKIARKLRFSLGLSVAIGVPGVVVLGLGAHFALSMFGPSYALAATAPLRLLLIGYLPTIPKVHYIAVCRATGRITRAAAVLTVSAATEVVAAAAGGASGGLMGLTVTLVAVFFLEGLVTAPPVIRAAIGHGRHRRAPTRVARDAPARPVPPRTSRASEPGTRAAEPMPWQHPPVPLTADEAVPERAVPSHHEEGIEVLLALARSAGVDPAHTAHRLHPPAR
jgi:O-antigen/teichoic acid export membrane protein